MPDSPDVATVIRYAAYGSNLHPTRLHERIPAARFIGTAHLPGWALRFNKRSTDDSGKCSIAVPGSGVYLAIYELTDGDKQVLDGIEGLGLGYDERTIEVDAFGPCYTYIGADTHMRAPLAPYEWYRDLVLLGCLKHGFPQGYVDTVRAVETTDDPDERRNRDKQALVARLRRAI